MITASFKQEVANYVNTRIAKVVLNESYEINEFEQKAVTDSTVALNYIVPAANVPVITRVELRDAADGILTTHEVNVPVSSDTLMLQTVEVKEVVN
ncbi:hypothetical protein [Paenibacillus sanguinis]|uniref:hypothetical protein n=1 Tax=Paenibacillus sanguinis TaxID=225906 RepID=UPI000364DF0E|nr:hypothetical protein [Paenibacillus sanguinis]